MKKKLTYIGIGIIVLALFGFGYYTISPLFINIKVDEASPEVKQAEPKAESGAKEEPEPKITFAEVVGTTAHPASGRVRIVKAEGKQYIRYENFKTINGPDIYVYLSNDLEAEDFVNLGRVKGTEGNINYEVPSHVRIADYKYVIIWCKAFGVLFNHADLAQISR